MFRKEKKVKKSEKRMLASWRSKKKKGCLVKKKKKGCLVKKKKGKKQATDEDGYD